MKMKKMNGRVGERAGGRKRKYYFCLFIFLSFFLLFPHSPTLPFSLSCISFISFAAVETEDKLTDFPQHIEINIIDTSKLEARKEKFSELFSPETELLQTLFPKERPSTIHLKSERSEPSMPASGRFRAILTAAPSLPQSLFYQALISQNLQSVNALLQLEGLNLSDQRNQGRGNYISNDLRGMLRYNNATSSSALNAETTYKSKELGWLSTSSTSSTSQNPPLRRLMSLFELYLKTDQSLSSQLKGGFEISGKGLESKDDLTAPNSMLDLRLSAQLKSDRAQTQTSSQLMTFGLEYFSSKGGNGSNSEGEDIWEVLGRIRFGNFLLESDPVSFQFAAEMASVPIGSKTTIFFNPDVSLKAFRTTNFEAQLNFRGELSRPELDELYYDRDFVELNPFLEVERSWISQFRLQYTANDISFQISDSHRVVDRLAAFVPWSYFSYFSYFSSDEKSEKLAWIPANFNAKLNEISASFQANIASYTILGRFGHEFQRVGAHVVPIQLQPAAAAAPSPRHIPYRPFDRFLLRVSYAPASDNLNAELSAEWIGPRYYHPDSDETLFPYFVTSFLFKKRLSENMLVFLDYQLAQNLEVFKGYKLASNVLGFGITVRF